MGSWQPDKTPCGDPVRCGPGEPGVAPAVVYWFTRALIGWLLVIAAQVVAWVLDWPIPPWHRRYWR